MELPYLPFTPPHLRHRYCPMCTTSLVATWDTDGLFRPQCPACSWTYYPPNVYGAVVVITTPEEVVFLFPPDEPAETPAALPAGCAEFGETPEEAAVREAREETGLEVALVRELGRGFDRDCDVGPMLKLYFEARMVGGALRDGPEGRVAICPEGAFPAISPNRLGSQEALAAYLASRH
jgi:8-oxo-dGTP diphosphatase